MGPGGVSVLRGGLCQGGLSGGSLSRGACLSTGGGLGLCPGGLCPGGSVQGGLCPGRVSVTVMSRRYASYWNAFLLKYKNIILFFFAMFLDRLCVKGSSVIRVRPGSPLLTSLDLLTTFKR